jgi:hypothetical protein
MQLLAVTTGGLQMLRNTLGLFALVATACGPGPGTTLPAKNMSATEHEQAAMRNERDAEAHEAEATRREELHPLVDQRCFDESVPSVSESGGEPMRVLRPCWTSLSNPATRERDEAERHREVAATHRKVAKQLRATENEQCAGLGEAERSRSPFAQRGDIVSVAEHRERGVLRGATIAFRRVPGLSAQWMRVALQCHAARAAVLGYPDKFMAYCPTTLPDVAISVTETDDTVVVTVRSDRDEIAGAILGRAQDLLVEPPAEK